MTVLVVEEDVVDVSVLEVEEDVVVVALEVVVEVDEFVVVDVVVVVVDVVIVVVDVVVDWPEGRQTASQECLPECFLEHVQGFTVPRRGIRKGGSDKDNT
uniref:hypothetical protein n=1 Tax=Flavobacterium sp. TaxID=239 RepID=UPI00404A3189